MDRPGLTRLRRGGGFSFVGPNGATVTDEETLARVRALTIPPAWTDVWICADPMGHLQAVGTDAAGRRQYLYHERWQQERAEEKFDRVLELSVRLPEWRAQIAKDLRRRGLERDRVLALALQLLDRGYFRAGGEQSAEEFEHYGLATLLCEHVTLRNGSVVFEYPAKSGVQRNVEIDDPEVVRGLRRVVGLRLLEQGQSGVVVVTVVAVVAGGQGREDRDEQEAGAHGRCPLFHWAVVARVSSGGGARPRRGFGARDGGSRRPRAELQAATRLRALCARARNRGAA